MYICILLGIAFPFIWGLSESVVLEISSEIPGGVSTTPFPKDYGEGDLVAKSANYYNTNIRGGASFAFSVGGQIGYTKSDYFLNASSNLLILNSGTTSPVPLIFESTSPNPVTVNSGCLQVFLDLVGNAGQNFYIGGGLNINALLGLTDTNLTGKVSTPMSGTDVPVTLALQYHVQPLVDVSFYSLFLTKVGNCFVYSKFGALINGTKFIFGPTLTLSELTIRIGSITTTKSQVMAFFFNPLAALGLDYQINSWSLGLEINSTFIPTTRTFSQIVQWNGENVVGAAAGSVVTQEMDITVSQVQFNALLNVKYGF